jgi:hypothetical protein
MTIAFVVTISLVGAATAVAEPDPELVVDETHQDLITAIGNSGDTTTGVPLGSRATGAGKPPRVGLNARTNAAQQAFPNGLLGRSETTIAVSEDGQSLVVGFNDAQGFCGAPFGSACTPQSPPGLSGYAYSSDGGLTWTDGGGPTVFNHVLTRGDPWLDRGGADGSTFFYANLAVHDTTGADLGISVHRGHFSGGTFSWQDVRVFGSPNNPGNCVTVTPTGSVPTPCDFYDKEALVAAKDGSGTAYVSLTNFQGQPTIAPSCGNQAQFGFGQIEVFRTHDSGNTWQGPVIAGPEAADSVADCGNTGTLQQSSVPSIGPNGELYVVWQFGPTFTATATSTNAQIRLARSLDGGVTFGAPISVANINSMRNNSPVGYNRDRINDHPRVAVATSGPNKGRVYVAYYTALAPVTAASVAACPAPQATQRCREQRLTSSQIFVKFSDDQGATWSGEKPIAPAPSATGTKRFWPVVSIEPAGNVDVVYYDSQETTVASGAFCNVSLGGNPNLRRRGTAHSLVDTFWSRSIDGGLTFETPIKLSSATTDWCTTVSNIRPNFGDYIGAASGGNRVFATWADGRNAVPDTFYATGQGAGLAR